ncbi:hypothetical protein ACJX0J_013517, partial [Zea mays]
VWNWFQNRRYSHRAKTPRAASSPPAKMTPSGADHHQHAANASAFRAAQLSSVAAAHHGSSSTGKNPVESVSVEFEAKSARDGAWYDVAAFLSHRLFESGDPEVRVRFSGFGAEEDEWINVRKCVRQRSLPCEATECVAVLPGDLILCFQEGKDQALYYDAHIAVWVHEVFTKPHKQHKMMDASSVVEDDDEGFFFLFIMRMTYLLLTHPKRRKFVGLVDLYYIFNYNLHFWWNHEQNSDLPCTLMHPHDYKRKMNLYEK